MGAYAISQAVPRLEDQRLLTGRGRFVDDENWTGQAHAYVLRSPHAHAAIRTIDTDRAAAAPGVLGVYTIADYKADRCGPLPHIGPVVKRRDGGPAFIPPFWPLADGRVRYVGDPLTFVVAETVAAAKDAAELIEVDYDPLPAITDTAAATEPGAPPVWDACADNAAFVFEIGDRAKTDREFVAAARIVEERLVITRVLANFMEMRGCIGHYDMRAARFHLWAPIQHPWLARRVLAGNVFALPEADIRVATEDVGGSFGIKANLYPEYVLALFAARRLGRPVKWIAERSESHLSDHHGRDNVTTGALALDAAGKITALRVRTNVNIGAYFALLGAGPATNNLGTLSGVYTMPASHVEVTGVLTNTQPTAPYRGAGRPEAAYVIERLVDRAARELGLDPAEFRRRNLIPASALPYKTALTFTYDSGNFSAILDKTLTAADYAGFAARRAEAARRGRLRGLGIAYAIERAAPPGTEHAELRFDAAGTATLLSGTTAQGQGHHTMYAQVLGDRLGLAPEQIRLVQGDTDRIAFGFGAGGSRCSALGTAAALIAADKVVEKGRRIAAHALEAAEADIAFAAGMFSVAGTDRRITLAEIAKRSFDPAAIPAGMEPGLIETGSYAATIASYPNGCHACEIEIDPETGTLAMLRYIVVDDFGTLINPLIVKGQVHGGVAQGAGQALMEAFVYDRDSGQAITGSFMDYCMPRADDLSAIEVESHPVPTTTNPLGVKGAGEAGNVGALPVVVNAVIDALAPLGITRFDMPATPERLWRAIRDARAASAG
ncbi:MAG: xanthine dehydrogenase family protein molybdopterin-binding subunit [Alphaproteobacteria bacterium]|nr:xanthine dehydrogenase family protein molybdopterin-binding subunit [Alphaproteobacteria bacterium]